MSEIKALDDMRNAVEIDAPWDVLEYGSVALMKLCETPEYGDLVDEVARSTHATAEEAFEGMVSALKGYLEGLS